MFPKIIFHLIPSLFHSVSHYNGIPYDMNNKCYKTLENYFNLHYNDNCLQYSLWGFTCHGKLLLKRGGTEWKIISGNVY